MVANKIDNRRKAQLIILTTFLLGVIAGASGQYLIMRQSTVNQPAAFSTQEWVDDMSRTVNLDSEQRTEIEKIATDMRQQTLEVRTKNRPQFNAIRDAGRQRIRVLLSPEQQSLFDKWNAEQDAKREKRIKEDAARK